MILGMSCLLKFVLFFCWVSLSSISGTILSYVSTNEEFRKFKGSGVHLTKIIIKIIFTFFIIFVLYRMNLDFLFT